ncbi:MAG: electron transfer flavoprotein subunit alpha/FixB family protein, partial [Proteobacteria bacterium]|nr:electron transfer flavoprotein subunit alpha/FixB family protein [Pseudomonadota bacterium]
MIKVLVVADIKQGALKRSTAELVSKAKSLEAEVGVVAVGSNIETMAADLVELGTDAQYIADDTSLEMFSSATFASCVVKAAERFQADQVWFPYSEASKAV